MFKFFKLIFIFTISLLIFPNNKIIVFGDRRGFRFADNSRYLFLLLANKSNFRCIWLSKNKDILKYLKNKNFECYESDSWIGKYYSLRAKWHIFNHSSRDTSENLSIFRNKLNLWHGTPVKIPKKFKKNDFSVQFLHKIKNYFIKDYLLLSDDKFSNHVLEHFPKKKYKTVIANLPRNIILKKNYKKLNYFRTAYEKEIVKKINSSNKKVIGYFPTFRENSKDIFIDFKKDKEFTNLNNFLKKNNSIILFKKHQNSFREDKSVSYNYKNDVINFKLSKLSNFITLEYECDLNSILSKCDLLITDYSGVVFDFLFLENPIIFYCPDIKKYKIKPGTALNIEKQDFAYFAKDKFQLYKLLNQYFKNKKKFKEFHKLKRRKMLNYIFPKKNFLKDIKKILKN